MYDVIVVGSGHAGIEATLASARLGCRTLMLTMNMDTIGLMPCNPSVGGPAKGQMVGEVDAMGGAMGRLADETHIQMKVLNRSRGPAVQCLRSQNDKKAYALAANRLVLSTPNVEVRQASVVDLVLEDGAIKGVVTALGRVYTAGAVVITTGTFLSGNMHVGLQQQAGGRLGEGAATSLSHALGKVLRLGRLKTGTPPRLDARSIDFSRMTRQPGDPEWLRFSFATPYSEGYLNQVDCYLTRTTPETHRIILDNLDRSPMYTKVIKGVGPRYCPSIEDKVVRFADKDSHHIFIEPEGRDSNEIYAQGLNTSLPEEVQERFLATMPGLERVVVLKPGYAVEYDFVYPDQLAPTLGCREIRGLYTAGQLNGTSGYEEAAGQGLVAGANAALWVQGRPPFVLSRTDSYIGTMIDDLMTKPIEEPYRMLTSRSEYRLQLRQDNPTLRLSDNAYEVGLLSSDAYEQIRGLHGTIRSFAMAWQTQAVPPMHQVDPPARTMAALMKRPDCPLEPLLATIPLADRAAARTAAIDIKYEGYLSKQAQDIKAYTSQDAMRIPEGYDFARLGGVRQECREKLMRYAPRTIGEAKRIAGVNPADLLVLMAAIKQHG